LLPWEFDNDVQNRSRATWIDYSWKLVYSGLQIGGVCEGCVLCATICLGGANCKLKDATILVRCSNEHSNFLQLVIDFHLIGQSFKHLSELFFKWTWCNIYVVVWGYQIMGIWLWMVKVLRSIHTCFCCNVMVGLKLFFLVVSSSNTLCYAIFCSCNQRIAWNHCTQLPIYLCRKPCHFFVKMRAHLNFRHLYFCPFQYNSLIWSCKCTMSKIAIYSSFLTCINAMTF